MSRASTLLQGLDNAQRYVWDDFLFGVPEGASVNIEQGYDHCGVITYAVGDDRVDVDWLVALQFPYEIAKAEFRYRLNQGEWRKQIVLLRDGWVDLPLGQRIPVNL